MSLARWLRRNSERYLLEAAQDDMARRYLGRMPDHAGDGPTAAFWRRVYVPVYRRIPWGIRRRLIVAMPGSHRRPWRGLGAPPPVAPPPDSPFPAAHEQGGREHTAGPPRSRPPSVRR